jgi:hypothetical protein
VRLPAIPFAGIFVNPRFARSQPAPIPAAGAIIPGQTGGEASAMADSATCPHRRQQLIARDQDATYVECLDCGEIFEADELAAPSGFDESLSDA